MLAGLVGGAAVLLVLAGAAKLVDPSRTAGALGALGWPSSPWLVRAGAAVELILGAAMLAVGGRVLPLLVAASYLGFALFVMAALRAKTPLATCGCFAQPDTPPSPRHVVIDGFLAMAAVVAAATDAGSLLDSGLLAWLVAAAVAASVPAVLRT